MKRDMILKETEVSIAVNKIRKLAENLIASVEEYRSIMDYVCSDCICDEEIDNEIRDIATLAESYSKAIQDVDDTLSGLVAKIEQDVEDNKDFDYPMTVMDEIVATLSEIF